MNIYCLVPRRDGVSHEIYEANPAWPAHPVGLLRPAFLLEIDLGYSTWVVFDRQSRSYLGTTPDEALEAFAN